MWLDLIQMYQWSVFKHFRNLPPSWVKKEKKKVAFFTCPPLQKTSHFSTYRVIRNHCRGFNNLSYTIHLRWEYMYFFYLIEQHSQFATYPTVALYVHPLWFYKHQHDNPVRSKLSVACQRWWFLSHTHPVSWNCA